MGRSPRLTSGANALAVRVEAPADRLVTLPVWGDGFATLGYLAAKWIESWLIQPNGPRAGKPVRLTAGQLNFLLWWYALDSNAQWVFGHGVRRLAKGTGKSPFAAKLALVEFCGPVRLERFDDRELGGVRGRPVDMPWVQIAATAESQTANTMRMVRAYAPKGSRVVDEYHIDIGKTKFYKQPEGTLETITSSATAAEGAESSFIVADETEHWLPGNGGPLLMSTLADNVAKSGARLIETSNAWKPGIGSVSEDTFGDWVAQEEGLLRGEQRILYDARVAPANTDLSDPGSLRAALEHVYADCDWKRDAAGVLNVRPIVERIWRKSSSPDDSQRKYLNRPTVALDAWVDPQALSVLVDSGIVVEKSDAVVMFFDGSKSNDATALVGCRVSDGHCFTLGVWEPDGGDVDSVVDVADVDRVVRLAFENHRVVGFWADVREWESFVLTAWPTLFEDRLMPELWATKNTRPPRSVAWDMRGHQYEFARACEAAESDILDASFTIDGHPVLMRHLANCRRRSYRDAVSVGKESPKSAKKIDAAVCLIGARMLRRVALSVEIDSETSAGDAYMLHLIEGKVPVVPGESE